MELRVSGRFALEAAGRFLSGWPPATHRGMSADGALRLAFVTDDLAGTRGVTLRPRAPDTLDATFTSSSTPELIAQVRRLLSLDLDGNAFEALGQTDKALGALQSRSPGARPVLFPNPYEATVWAVLSARVPAARGAVLRRALMAEHGRSIDVGGDRMTVLPTPDRLLEVEELPGTPAEKIRRLHGVAQAALDGVLDASTLAKLPPQDALAQLKSIRGIGDFYAMLILVRALGVDFLPVGEPRLLAAAGGLLGRNEPLSETEFEQLAADWQPFRAWAAFLLRTT
ncbi:MAG: DNA-3-methyladenine glycosylase 2 family protein [Actinomycetota bacterium]